MNKLVLLPRLSVMGIRKNGSAYIPYILAGIFSVFTFFVFTSIINNDISKTLPHSGYAIVLMQIGQVLLGLILLPFILYTNSFLIKRRKKELGLYSILGLDKKHISVMMLWETLIIFGIVMSGGIIFGMVFSKLFFLILLNLSELPVSAEFKFSLNAFKHTFIYFLAVYGFSLVTNVIHVYRMNPNDLMKDPKKGDREPRHIWLTAFTGILLLGIGYAIAILSEVDLNIFVNFLLAVSLVVIGTHQFFKAGLLALLKILKRNEGIYYRRSNFVTISGMLHRMRKSASSLSNICIFGTMTVITLLCTLSVWLGTDSMLVHQFPYDFKLNFNTVNYLDGSSDEYRLGELNNKLQELAAASKLKMTGMIHFTYQKLHIIKNDSRFTLPPSSGQLAKRYAIKLISLEDYNRMENKRVSLAENEVLIFASGADYGFDHITLGNETWRVKEELKSAVFSRKAVSDTFGQDYYIIVEDTAVMDKLRDDFLSNKENDRILTVMFNLEGPEENKKEFINKAAAWSRSQPGFNSYVNGIGGRLETASMTGALLFIGIFFSVIFTMCLILIMYYKQITEGYDDRDNFGILQKVGMSDAEVRQTIKKQILMVFYSPLIISMFHTMAGFKMIKGLLGTLSLFDTGLIIMCGLIVAAFFAVLYGMSYGITSRTYYRIVRQMNNDEIAADSMQM